MDLDVRLTEDEKAVVFGFAQNEAQSEIAKELGVSEECVQQSVDEILRKLHLGSFLCALVPVTDEAEVVTDEAPRELVAV